MLAGLKGGTEVPLRTDLIINRALTVVGAFVDARAYAEAIRIIESRRFPLEKLHTHTFGLDDTARAMETSPARWSVRPPSTCPSTLEHRDSGAP